MTLNQAIMELVVISEYPKMPFTLRERIKGIIDAMSEWDEPEQEADRWISCSERLPELKEWVLVSSGDCVVSDCLVVRGGNKIWYECGTIDIEHDAWQPLPEPYKEAEHDE